MKIHLDIKIFGQVQGVSFRAFVKKCADELNVKGFVENQANNCVYIEAEGNKEEMKKFTEWCKAGPGFAKVEDIKTEEGKTKNYFRFEIRY